MFKHRLLMRKERLIVTGNYIVARIIPSSLPVSSPGATGNSSRFNSVNRFIAVFRICFRV